ncbi:hypothetical protein [Roseomonas elaeocarpi]|uniref:EAL domain-containing protein n=1 Tax=Roseomonas elaeocarpi TaxID=907779 RepID=A0ABV6JSH0_9PROT
MSLALLAEPPAGNAAELAALLRDCSADDRPREVAWLRFSALPSGMDRPHHHRLLREAVRPPNSAQGRSFHLPNGDFAVVALTPRVAGTGIIAATREALAGALEAEVLGRVFRPMRLPEEGAAVLAALEESLGLVPDAPMPSLGRLDAAGLRAAERALAQADVWPLHARQTICRLPAEDARFEPVREDVRPMPEAVREQLLDGCEPGSLAGPLAEALSSRLLRSLLSRRGWLGEPAPLHLPLPLSALAGESFLRLDRELPRSLRPLLTLGIGAAEVLRDAAGFRFARDFVRSRGYRLVLEVGEPEALRYLPPRALAVDGLRIGFSPALPAAAQSLREGLRRDWPEVVLAGCDTAAAIAWGWEAGLRLFQGRAIQRRRGD